MSALSLGVAEAIEECEQALETYAAQVYARETGGH